MSLVDKKIALIRINLTDPPIKKKGESTGEPWVPKLMAKGAVKAEIRNTKDKHCLLYIFV